MAAANVLFPNGGQSVPLPNVSVTGVPVGFILTDSGGTSWQLSVSSAAVDHSTVEAVAGNANLRWLVFTAAAVGRPLWLAKASARAVALGGAFNGEWYTDYASSNDFGSSANTNASALVSATLDGGVVNIVGGATATSRATIYPPGQGAQYSAVTKPMYQYHRVRWTGPQDTQTYQHLGLFNGTNPWITFGYKGTNTATFGANLADQTHFSVSYNNGSVVLPTLTSLAFDAAAYHDVEFFSDGTTGTFYFDGVAVNVTIPIASVAANPLWFSATSFNGSGTGTQALSIDKSYSAFSGQ